MYYIPHNSFIKSTNRSENDMNKATLTFQSQEMAKSFCSAWACKTLTGHDMSAKKSDGSFDVTVYDLDDSKIEWINSYVEGANNE